MRFKKYIILKNEDTNEVKMRIGYPIYHKDLIEQSDKKNGFKCVGGGQWNLDYENKSIRLFGHSSDFGRAKKEDIEKASPKQIIPDKTNRPNFNLSNKDIEGTEPRGHHCFNTSRHVDPLNPDYPLPTCHDKYPLPVPMFLRNTLDVRDIPGATVKKNLVYINRIKLFHFFNIIR